MNQTTNYQLSQWESTDRILMSDFNSDNSKIDAALGTLAQAVTGHTTALTQKGNCQIYFDTYTGTGSGATVLTFPKAPKLVFITGTNDRVSMTLAQGAAATFSYNGNYAQGVELTWSENTVSIVHLDGSMSYQCNESGAIYLVVALIAADE